MCESRVAIQALLLVLFVLDEILTQHESFVVDISDSSHALRSFISKIQFTLSIYSKNSLIRSEIRSMFP